MEEFRDWLERHGLAQYADAMAGQDIDFSVLPHLTEEDIDRLGLSLGHRRKLLTAIADLRGTRDAERRQVTVMFCDLVGSTELANNLDPEDMSLLLRRYQDSCAGAIARFDGLLARFMGDGVLAYFGYPHAQEDAGERSIRAALGILEGVTRILRPDGRPIQARLGIATGVVVIGDLIGRGIAQEHSIVGETPNLAARLQALGEPGTILVSQSTRNLVGKQFELELIGNHALKGFAAPVPVWRVHAASMAGSRFAAARAALDCPFVGRDAEMRLIADSWSRAAASKGEAVCLVGDAGIGKSRIVEQLRSLAVPGTHQTVFWQSSPYHVNTALHPVITYLEQAAGFHSGDPVAARIDKLEHLLGPQTARASVALIAELLFLPVEGRYPASELLPAQRMTALIEALIEHLAFLSAQSAILLVVEDAHWIDPTTRELVKRLLATIAARRILVLITMRPEGEASPQRIEVTSTLLLGRLPRAQCVEMVAAMNLGLELGSALVDDIVSKTDGVPLFVEELTRAVMESESRNAAAIPATLHDSLMARLDRMGPAKEVTLVAAAIGVRFSRALLRAVAEISPAQLAASLERLVRSGVFVLEESALDALCSFKHALLRDVAYESMLRTRRQVLHARIAGVLEGQFPAVTRAEPELLAHHFDQAGLPARALAYREQAGERAVARTNYAEAVNHFQAAIEAVDVQGVEGWSHELALLLKLGPALSILKGPRNAEVEALYRRAQGRARDVGDEGAFFKATWGLWFTAHVSRNLEVSLMRAQELVGLGRQSGDADLMLEAIHCRWATAAIRGDVRVALDDAREGVGRYDEVRDAWMGSVFGGHDPCICAHGALATSLAQMGLPSQARRSAQDALELADRLKHPPSLSQSIQTAMVTHQLLGDHEGVAALSRRMIAMADRFAFTTQRPHALFLAGWSRVAAGDCEGGLKAMEEQYPAGSTGLYYRYYAALLAEARMKAGLHASALALLDSTLATLTGPSLGFYVPELHRLRGECLARSGRGGFEEAVRSMLTAVGAAASQHAPMLQLRASLSLARACRQQGQAARGMDVLRAARGALPEGFVSPELGEVEALLGV